MKKIKMTITINDKFEVNTTFKGNTDELAKCNRALTLHIKDQQRYSNALANASNFTEERGAKASTDSTPKEALPRRYA